MILHYVFSSKSKWFLSFPVLVKELLSWSGFGEEENLFSSKSNNEWVEKYVSKYYPSCTLIFPCYPLHPKKCLNNLWCVSMLCLKTKIVYIFVYALCVWLYTSHLYALSIFISIANRPDTHYQNESKREPFYFWMKIEQKNHLSRCLLIEH